MKNVEIVELTTEELLEQIAVADLDLTRMKMNHAVSPLENPMKIREIRRSIARMKTEVGRRNAEAANNSEKSE